MFDFQGNDIGRMSVAPHYFDDLVAPYLVEGEYVSSMYRAARDGAVFTNKRIMVIDVQGMSGKKIDITSIPYSKIQAFSTETAGKLDFDSELEFYVSSIGKIKLYFSGQTNITQICKLISAFVLA